MKSTPGIKVLSREVSKSLKYEEIFYKMGHFFHHQMGQSLLPIVLKPQVLAGKM